MALSDRNMPLHNQAQILTKTDILAAVTPSLSWRRAAGLLRAKKSQMERHLKRVRAEWRDKR